MTVNLELRVVDKRKYFCRSSAVLVNCSARTHQLLYILHNLTDSQISPLACEVVRLVGIQELSWCLLICERHRKSGRFTSKDGVDICVIPFELCRFSACF